MSRWDNDIPASIEEVVDFLRDAISVHEQWIEYGEANPDHPSLKAAGGPEHHRTTVKQYEAAIKIIESRMGRKGTGDSGFLPGPSPGPP